MAHFEQKDPPDGSDFPAAGEADVSDDASGLSPDGPGTHGGIANLGFTSCALLARPSDWTRELTDLGVKPFKRPESLYNAIRTRSFDPRCCIVDLDSVPRNMIRSIDMRVPCPKIWIGKSASNPSDIKTLGIYHARARADELNAVMARLAATDASVMLPSGMVGKQSMPLLAADDAYRERLLRYVELFADSNLITVHGDDLVELHLVAQYLAVETHRPRIWNVKSDASIHPTLRRVSQARRPGTDVSIILGHEVDLEAAREFYRAMPSEYSMIKLSGRSDNPIDALSLTLPRPSERPDDIENWVVWFVSRSTIDYGIALSDFTTLVESIKRMLGGNPEIEEIRSVCERAIRQHATINESPGEFQSYDDLVRNYERTILRHALTRFDWNLSATAKSLGLAESSLRYKLNKLGIDRKSGNDT